MEREHNTQTQVFAVAEMDIFKVAQRLDAVIEKAEKYGCTVRYSFGEKYVFNVKYYDGDSAQRAILGVEGIAAADCTVESESVVAGDYEAVAMIEHLQGGNVVKAFGEMRYKAIPEDWRTRTSHCEHCGTKRRRKITYMVKSRETGEYKQVGGSCLKDYTGIDPQAIAAQFAIIEIVDVFSAVEERVCGANEFAEKKTNVFSVMAILAFAAESVAKYGYSKSDAENSTKEDMYKRAQDNAILGSESIARAEQIKEWITTASDAEICMSDLLYNARSVIRNGICSRRHFGYIAYLPVAYDKAMRRRAEREQERQAHADSRHIGAIGERITIDVTACELVTSWQNNFGGNTWLYRMTDASGNAFVWFASKPIDEGFKSGRVIATVKDHTEREGIKQTAITRCKIA